MSRTLAIVFVGLALAVGVGYLLWWYHKAGKKRERETKITKLIEKAESGDKRELLRLWRESVWTEEYVNEFGLEDRYHSLIGPFSEEVQTHPEKLNGWVADNLPIPAFDDFEGLVPYIKMRDGQLSLRLATALRKGDYLELAICLAYRNRWPYWARQDVPDGLWAEAVKMFEKQTAMRNEILATR